MYIGAQLFGIPEEVLKSDLTHVLNFISETGYDGVELPFLLEAERELNQLGLDCIGVHISPEQLVKHHELIGYLERHECRNLYVSGPLGWHDRSLDNFGATCGVLNSAAKLYAKEGIKVQYHNHDFEFLINSCESSTPFSILQNELDFENIDLCIDVGWLHLAGVNVNDFLHEHRDKVSHLHLRDFAKTESVALGQGSVPLPQVYEQLNELNRLKWVVIEFEPTLNFKTRFKQSWQHLNPGLLCIAARRLKNRPAYIERKLAEAMGN
ncbi:sugar phosphate isomerase/epimerase family protein [Photobacterium sanguinicancri]|uniref:Sugar phosphate isomerase/epimerase n=1 Tax=Photobacterium sanguinicancri TaxID=875932 RepID=A0AAW7YDV9_9GAMM|nr:sugar phosphate isomerase/epimerase [Photobacterium sanguinicancri]MDO6545473.1 sugar phosphate isomerase/epimerase [Photobacterium sanguinicancri]